MANQTPLSDAEKITQITERNTQLEAELKKATTGTADQAERNRQFEAKLKEATTVIANQAERNTQLEAELKEATTVITDQAEQLLAAEAQGASAALVVTHDKQHYRVLVPQFQFEGRVVRASELKDDAKLLAALIKAESGILKKIEKPQA